MGLCTLRKAGIDTRYEISLMEMVVGGTRLRVQEGQSLKPGNVYEMRKTFYSGVAEGQVNAPVGELSKGMTLDEMRRELLGR